MEAILPVRTMGRDQVASCGAEQEKGKGAGLSVRKKSRAHFPPFLMRLLLLLLACATVALAAQPEHPSIRTANGSLYFDLAEGNVCWCV